MDIKEYRQKPLSEKIAQKIMDYITDNNLRPQDKLPSETALAEKFQVGRGSVREAVKTLISRNILIIRRGAGTYVADNFGVSSDPLGLDFIRDKRKLTNDILKIRLLIEPEIAAMAAQNASGSDIAELELLCAKVDRLMRAGKYHVASDQDFHAKIIHCSDNSVVVNLAPIIRTSIELFVDMTHSRLIEETIQTHREILNAIKNHDALKARDAMKLHLMYNKHMLERFNE